MRRIILIHFALLLLTTAVAHGKTITVRLDGTGDYTTIQDAIDNSNNGDIIEVAPGTYTGPGNKELDFRGKPITVCSENGPNNCTIDCQKRGRGFFFHNAEDANSILDGFTITNGESVGGGIRCDGSSPTIKNCSITGNIGGALPGAGGGILCIESNPIITNCTISENMSDGISCLVSNPTITNCRITGNKYGGGIFCHESSPTITNCKITGNSAEWEEGGGIYCECGSNPTISNCTIAENQSSGIRVYNGSLTAVNCIITGNRGKWGGGGISCQESNLTITNSTISGNTAEWGAGIYCGSPEYNTRATIKNCTISGNSAEGEYAYGGGIFCAWGNQKITNCIITGNKAKWGGGIDFGYCNPIITNCTISGNTAEIDGGGINCTVDSNPIIANCILWSNTASQGNQIAVGHPDYPEESTLTVSYSDVQGEQDDIYVKQGCMLHWKQGNIDADPCFVEPGYWDVNCTPDEDDYICNYFWIDGDYHLLPDSPCIDAGDPNYIAEPNETDLDGNPRVRGDAIDMGAYETIIHEARLLVLPRVLNRKSNKPRIMAWVRLPQGITKDQIDSDEPLILYPGGIKAMRQFVFQNRRRDAQRVSIFAFFDKAELMDAIPASGRVELQVLGHLRQPGQYFSASDTIRIKSRR